MTLPRMLRFESHPVLASASWYGIGFVLVVPFVAALESAAFVPGWITRTVIVLGFAVWPVVVLGIWLRTRIVERQGRAQQPRTHAG